jgi:hypothetical protein
MAQTVSWLGQTEAPPDHSTIVGTDAQEDAATQADAAADAVTGQQNSQAGRRRSTPVARSKLS